MRKSGLYTSDLYIEYAGAYSDCIEWREKSIGRTGKNIAMFLLAAVIGIASVNPLAGRIDQVKAAMSQTSEAAVTGGASTKLTLLPQKEQAEIPSIPLGTLEKEPGDILIVLDPGHGGEDEGCARDGVEEKEVNLRIALEIQRKLLEKGYQVKLTRNQDMELALEDRAKTANETGADLYISIHQNSSQEANADGIEVWYSRQNQGEESERLSRIIQKYAVQNTGAKSRELVENEELYVIRECTMPSCLIETGFLSNKAECDKLAAAEYQERLEDVEKYLKEQKDDGVEDIYWELAGSGDPGESSQLLLVGLMIDKAEVNVNDGVVELILSKKLYRD